jgi:hypothetical protein
MLRMNYRRLAALHHPDKTTGTRPEDEQTLIFQEIQAAYQELKKFYTQHGQLPLAGAYEFPIQEHKSSKPTISYKKPRLSLSYTTYALIVLIILVIYVIPAQEKNKPIGNTTSSTQQITTPTSVNDTAIKPINSHPIKLGMTMGKVFEILGVPDANVGDHWYYGNSAVFFRDGHIAGWRIDSHSPILVQESKPANITPPARIE